MVMRARVILRIKQVQHGDPDEDDDEGDDKNGDGDEDDKDDECDKDDYDGDDEESSLRMQIYSKTMMIRILSQELDKQWSIGVETVVRLKRKYFLIKMCTLHICSN